MVKSKEPDQEEAFGAAPHERPVPRISIAAFVEFHDTGAALQRAGSDRRNLQHLPLDLVVGDLANDASLDRALADCQALFHLAADYRLGVREPQQLYRTNVEGTRNILSAAEWQRR